MVTASEALETWKLVTRADMGVFVGTTDTEYQAFDQVQY